MSTERKELKATLKHLKMLRGKTAMAIHLSEHAGEDVPRCWIDAYAMLADNIIDVKCAISKLTI